MRSHRGILSVTRRVRSSVSFCRRDGVLAEIIIYPVALFEWFLVSVSPVLHSRRIFGPFRPARVGNHLSQVAIVAAVAMRASTGLAPWFCSWGRQRLLLYVSSQRSRVRSAQATAGSIPERMGMPPPIELGANAMDRLGQSITAGFGGSW